MHERVSEGGSGDPGELVALLESMVGKMWLDVLFVARWDWRCGGMRLDVGCGEGPAGVRRPGRSDDSEGRREGPCVGRGDWI